MSDWMKMTAADLDPSAAWQQYRKATGTPEQASAGNKTLNLLSIFRAGIEYADASR